MIGDTVEQQLSNPRQRLVSGVHRATGTTRRVFDAAAGFIAGEDEFALAGMKFLKTGGERFVARIEFWGERRGGLGDGVEHGLVEHDFGTREFLTGVTDAPISNLASPRHEVGARSELVKFLADDDAGFLQQILSVVTPGHERVDVRENLALVPSHQRHESLLVFGVEGGRRIHGR